MMFGLTTDESIPGREIAIFRRKNVKGHNRRNKNIVVKLVEDTEELDEDDMPLNISRQIACPIGCEVHLLPTGPNNERSIHFIASASGGGKSTLCADIAKLYMMMYDEPVHLISKIKDDPAFSDVKDLIIHDINSPDFMSVTDSYFYDSMVIFDDTDAVANPAIYNKIEELKKSMLETGRHHNVSVVCTSHLLTNRDRTKTILNEMHTLTFFPYGCSMNHIRYVLNTYCGLDNNMIKDIIALNSRWVTLLRQYPQIVLHQGGVFLLR